MLESARAAVRTFKDGHEILKTVFGDAHSEMRKMPKEDFETVLETPHEKRMLFTIEVTREGQGMEQELCPASQC